METRLPDNGRYVAVKDLHIGVSGEPVRYRLDIELTERRNNNCIHCCINLPADDAEAIRGELTTREILGILEQAVALNYITVRFTGGEPLLRPDFPDLYLAARRMGLNVLLFTNATLITPEIADMLARIPPRELVEVTMYGLSRKSYESVSRMPGSYEAARRGIQLLQEREVPFIIKGVILPGNRHEIGGIISWARSMGWMDRDPTFTLDFDLRVRRDDERRNARIRRLRTRWDEGLRLLHHDMDRYIEDCRGFAARFMRPSGDKLFTCSPKGSIDSRGFFNPCMQLKSPALGYDLRQGSLREAVTEHMAAIMQMRASNPEYLRRCARCFLKGFCEQCPTKAWLETGTLDTPSEYHCAVAHERAQHLGLLRSHERAWEVVDWESRLIKFCGDKWIG